MQDKKLMKQILGAAAGDIIGSSYEFKGYRIKTTDFPLYTERSHFTDDTVCTAAICKWLMEDRNNTHEHLAKCLLELGLRYYDPKRLQFGPGFRSWLLQESASTILGRPHVTGNSHGNGSAMRVSPIGICTMSPHEAEDLAMTSAEVTHNNQEGMKGAMAIAGSMTIARLRDSKDQVRAYMSHFGYNMNRTIDEIRPTYKFEDTCEKSVPEAVIAYLEANSFENAIRLAVSLGGDADTQGAMAGALAAVTPGMEMPDEIFDKTKSYLDDYLWGIFSDFEKWVQKS